MCLLCMRKFLMVGNLQWSAARDDKCYLFLSERFLKTQFKNEFPMMLLITNPAEKSAKLVIIIMYLATK